jgi:type IV secretion system protein VirB5
MTSLQKFLRSLLGQAKTRWAQGAEKELASHTTTPTTDNPYAAARHEYNLMYGNLIKAKYNWQRISFLALAANLLLIIGLLWLSGQSRYIPYAVKVDALGNTSFAGYLTREANISPLELNAFIRRWIENARAVIADPIAEKQSLDFVYAASTQGTSKVLNEFYRANDPFKAAQQATVEVEVNAVLQKTDNSWQVDWTETQRDLDGKVVGVTHWEALMTIGQHPVTDQKILDVNPLSLFVEHLSWTQQI